MRYYPFAGKLLDLEELRFVEEAAPLRHFKNAGRYAQRFKTLSIDKVGYKGQLFEIMIGHGIKRSDVDTKQSFTLDNPEEGKASGGQNVLFNSKSGVLYLKQLEGLEGFVLYKYNEEGKQLFRLQIEHTEFVRRQKIEFFRPYLRYFKHNNKRLLFSSYDSNKAISHIVNLETGKIESKNFSLQGFLPLADEQDIEALIERLDSQSIAFRDLAYSSEVATRAKAARFALPNWQDATQFEALRLGSTLYILAYNSQCRGYVLSAFEDKTAKLLWTVGEIAPKSEAYHYHNIWLSASASGKEILVEGLQVEGRYLKVYASETGQVLLEAEKHGNK